MYQQCSLLKTDLENCLHGCVNFEIIPLFIKIHVFTNEFKTKSKQVYFQIILLRPTYSVKHDVKIQQNFL